MRRDMAKVIVERPRTGGKGGRPPRYEKNADMDDLPVKEGMRRRHSEDRKELNENLRPLERYLNKQVGRPWDKIWADICKNLRNDSAVQKHVRDHVWNFVEKNVVMKNNIPHYSQRYTSGPLRPLHKGDLYIHPGTGILTRVKHNATKKR